MIWVTGRISRTLWEIGGGIGFCLCGIVRLRSMMMDSVHFDLGKILDSWRRNSSLTGTRERAADGEGREADLTRQRNKHSMIDNVIVIVNPVAKIIL